MLFRAYRLNQAIETTDNKILSCSKTGKTNQQITAFLCEVFKRDLRTSPGNLQEKNYTVGSLVRDHSWCTEKCSLTGGGRLWENVTKYFQSNCLT